MERDMLNAYFIQKEELLSLSFYKRFAFAYEINHRKLYIWSKKKIINSPYLESDLKSQIPLLYSVYLEGKEYNVPEEKIDLDFEVGINNFDFDFENSLLKYLLKKYDNVFVLIKHQRNIINKTALEKLNVLLERKGSPNEYLIKLSGNALDFDIERKSIYGIFVSQGNCTIDSWEDIYFNENDLLDISTLSDNFTGVFMKVSFYANYNWMLYSQYQNVCDDLVEGIQEICNEKDIIYSQNRGIDCV